MEEQKGLIKRNEKFHKDLFKRKSEAQDALDTGERKRAVDRARADVDAALKEADAMDKARRFDDALAKLKIAEAAARLLDARTQRTIAEAAERIKKEQQDLAEVTTRAQRVEQGLLEGARLLEEGNGNEASTRFDAVLAVDPQNAKALEGKKRSKELILATTTRLAREAAFQAGKAFVEAGRYAEAIEPLTNAAVDIPQANELLKRAQKMREGLKKQRETQAEIDRLLEQGEGLMAAGQFAAAQVSFDGVLRLDPGHTKARERLDVALEKTVETVLAKYQRDERPTLIFPKGPENESEVDAPTVSIVGAAWDDRGIQKVEFHLNGKLVAELAPPRGLDTGEAQRQQNFDREFPLEPGRNEILVSGHGYRRSLARRRPSSSTGGCGSTRRGPSFPPPRAGPWVSSRWARWPRACGGVAPSGAASTPTSRAPPSSTTTCSSGARGSWPGC